MSEKFNSELDGRVAIVTDTSSGIGSTTAKSLVSRGASVIATARREDEFEELVATTEDDDDDALVIPTDVIVDDNTDAFVEATLDRHGHIGIFVNNADPIPSTHIGETDHEVPQTAINVNLTGLITLAHMAVPVMIEQESGHIVSLSSVVGRFLQVNSSHHSATRTGVEMFSNSLRLDVTKADIRVSSVGPGTVDMESFDHIPDEEVQENVRDYIDIVDTFTFEDIVRTIMFVVMQPEHAGINEVLTRPLDQTQP